MTVADTATPPEQRIALEGELCVDTIDGMRRVLTDAATRGGTIVIDLAAVTILSAAAVALLVKVPGIAVTNPSPLSRAVLEAVGLEDLIVQ